MGLTLVVSAVAIGVLAAPASAKVDKRKFCAAWIEAQNREEETLAQIKRTEKLLKGNGPASLQDEVTVIAAAARKATEGSDGAFDTPKVGKALTTVGNYTYKACASERFVATAVDYSYSGLPAEIPAGKVAIKLTNRGKEPHEIGLARVKDGVTGTAQEIIQQVYDAGQNDPGTVDFVGGTFAQPGASGVLLADLEPGRYVYACFVPIGGQDGAAPHFSQGMFGEFTSSPA